MLDMHCHILYGVDDGAKTILETEELIKQEISSGVDHIVFTPHQNENTNNSLELRNVFNEIKDKFKDYQIHFELGSEIYYYPNMDKDLDNKKLLTLNDSKYVLVEFSTYEETNIADILYDLKVSGYKPIIAHIERYSYLKFSDYDEIKKYALIQVNSLSFEKKEYKKILKYLLKNNMVSFIASDCHNPKSRPANYDTAKKIISKKYKDCYSKLFETDFKFE